MDQVTISRELLLKIEESLESRCGTNAPERIEILPQLRELLDAPAVEPDWSWVCNECGSSEYTASISETDIQDLACGNCGGWDFHKGLKAPQAQQPAPVQEPLCNPHPKAPHGFDRNASHSAHRYVCDCESWEPYDAGYNDGFQAGLKAEQALCELSDQTQEMEAQQPRKAVKLSDTTIDDVTKAQWGHDQTYAAHRAYARAIEQAVWEKLGVAE